MYVVPILQDIRFLHDTYIVRRLFTPSVYTFPILYSNPTRSLYPFSVARSLVTRSVRYSCSDHGTRFTHNPQLFVRCRFARRVYTPLFISESFNIKSFTTRPDTTKQEQIFHLFPFFISQRTKIRHNSPVKFFKLFSGFRFLPVFYYICQTICRLRLTNETFKTPCKHKAFHFVCDLQSPTL